jgi:hypothetical protein
MAFRATNDIPEDGLKIAKEHARQLQSFCTTSRDAMTSTVDASRITDTLEGLDHYKEILNDLKSIPGIVDYAKDQENDPAYEVVTEFNAMLANIQAAGDLIVSLLESVRGGTYDEISYYGTDWKLNWRQVTPGQSNSIRSALTDIINGIV